jgi:AraC-like DNA-binding protein
MSRSAFAARFTDLVGEPAMHYLTKWRMQAARLADRGGCHVAARLGYRSEGPFSRAFKCEIGVSLGVVG